MSYYDEENRKWNDPSKPRNNWNNWNKLYGTAATAAAIGGITMFAMWRYRVSMPNEYIVRTGPFIDGISISKKSFQYPFQTASRLLMAPSNYKFNLQAMSREKMEFVLPGVFTIGPKNDVESLEKYALLLGNEEHEKIDEIIEGVIEGEKAVIGAFITLQEPTKPMKEAAAAAGFYEPKMLPGKLYPKIQILTIEDILNSKTLEYPRVAPDVTFKKAGRLSKDDDGEQVTLF